MVGYVGYVAWRRTKSSEDYMVAGRNTHPYIMALSYGATFISTAAIVGFGGVAANYGFGILWLVFLNIIVGIFIAFIFFGKRTRKMGHNLSALTFPEFVSRRFNSKFIQYFSGAVIFLGMPLYASVVLIGMARFVETTLGVNYYYALIAMAIIVAVYVVFGGIRGVMYTDALQGTIMFFGMAILLGTVYWMFGGVINSNLALSNLSKYYTTKCYFSCGSNRIYRMDSYANIWQSILVDFGVKPHIRCWYWGTIPTTVSCKVHDS